MTKTFPLAFLVFLSHFIISSSASMPRQPLSQITSSYDAVKKQTTVRLAPAQISGEKDKYHSLHYSVFYSYPGKTKRVPQTLSLELLTVVKARLLDPDLYVVFLLDGDEVFLSSSRSAVFKPVPGKHWIGERLVFRLPYETFLRFAGARQIGVKMDGLTFDFTESNLSSLRDFARAMKE